MPFTLPELPYAYDALADLGMSPQTLERHHALHRVYVVNCNALIPGTAWEGMGLEELICHSYAAGARAQSAVFNNASQHWNHSAFWLMMGPEPEKPMPAALKKALNKSFGSVQAFKDAFIAAGAAHFGSGWAWLVRGYKKSLQILTTENGVNPLCFGQTVLLGCDLWEHGYHGDFGIERQVYLMNFLDRLVNWENVASRM